MTEQKNLRILVVFLLSTIGASVLGAIAVKIKNDASNKAFQAGKEYGLSWGRSSEKEKFIPVEMPEGMLFYGDTLVSADSPEVKDMCPGPKFQLYKRLESVDVSVPLYKTAPRVISVSYDVYRLVPKK